MSRNTEKSGSRTLLLSVLMSLPGPLVVGLGLLVGRSATQLADFVRRSSELLALIMAYVVFRATNQPSGCTPERKAALERRSNRFVGAMMALGGSFMLLLAALPQSGDKGNVIPGLAIALMGVVANSLFWRKYTKLNRQTPNAILAVQARLYRAKSLVDGCVTAALLAVAIAPEAPFAAILDRAGSMVVALYLVWCGLRTVWESRK